MMRFGSRPITAQDRRVANLAPLFVRTLKEWLADKSCQDDRELTALLQKFLDDNNDRPHQALLIPGLSPNEFARRIWLM